MELLRSSATGMTFSGFRRSLRHWFCRLSHGIWDVENSLEISFSSDIGASGHAMEFMGYWDSGNQLRDPYNHRPVCILSRHMAAKILNPKKDGVHFIPYCSLGQEKASAGDRIACIKIQNGRHEVEIRQAAVGIANESYWGRKRI